jgi:putative membrane protein
MTIARGLLAAHALAAVFGVAGIVVALGYPELWAHSAAATDVFSFGMRWGGFAQIALGALAVFGFGGVTVGWRGTAVFFAIAVLVSLGAELVGTSTGWPFGNYEYGDVLGPKVLGRVPVAIPLSWFALGFSSFALGTAIARRHAPAGRALPIVLGAALLTVWDLALDPAMAHESMPLRFWFWHERGAYLGMPVQNFVGWTATGATFMALARPWLGPDAGERLARRPGFPLAIYVVNVAFAAALDASVGLWAPIALAAGLGILPSVVLARDRAAATDLRRAAARPRERPYPST